MEKANAISSDSTCKDTLAVFNIVAKRYAEAVRALGKAMVGASEKVPHGTEGEQLNRLRKRVDGLLKELKEIESRLPLVKFDFVNGEYFYGEKDGKEVFRFRIIRKDVGFVDVAARSAADARRIAERMAKNGDVKFTVAPYDVQNIANLV